MSATDNRLALGLAVALVAVSGRARAQEAPEPAPEWSDPPPDAAPAAPEPSPAPSQIERPTLTTDAKPRYPEKAWNDQLESDVVVLLTLDTTGAVIEAEVAEAAGHGFDEEALRAARKLRFSPARIDGVATAVQIRYTFRFRITEKASVAAPPAPAATAATDGRKPSKIVVTVYERGRGKRLAGVEVYLLDEDRVVLTDTKGRFEIAGPPGAYAFTIRPPGFYPYQATERVEEGQTLEVEYFVRRHRRGRYSTVVWGSDDRAELARTSLVDDEIRTVAGTLGDPIRVAMLLPGVTSSISGASYPIIRGALPGDSLYEVDGIRIPMLYHLLVGPAVIHPRFVNQIEFQPGGYSAELGRFPGGRIGATTARIDDDPLWVADLSIVETSLFRSQRVGRNGEAVAAARYGTLGYIVEGISSDLIFSYWDYQTRAAYRLPNGARISVTVLGASDTAGEKNPDTGEQDVLSVGFHTADVRYRQALGQAWVQAGVQVGHEFFEPPEEEDDDMPDAATMETLRPYAEVGYEPSWGRLAAGGDVLYQDFGLMLTDDDTFDYSADSGITIGAWIAARLPLGDRFQLEPSMRIDHYRYDAEGRAPRETSFDPRLAAAFDITDDLALKVGTGVYSGPTRYSFVEPPIVFGPIPGWEGPGISRGLSRTRQYHAGIEADLPAGFGVMLTGYYHDQDLPVDFSLIDQETEPDVVPCDGLSPSGTQQPFDVRGSSVGAELLVRRRLGRSVFGWLSYGLSRSNRTIATGKTIPFEFDQRHVLNAVLSWDVGRNWTIGGVFHFNTGRPYTPSFADQCGLMYYEERPGEPYSARLPNHWRVNVRIQKREVFDTWFFDFYIDFFNAAFQWETIGYDTDLLTGEQVPEQLPLFIPMIGIRGEL